MASRDDIVIEITPQVLLKAYACGIFPMAESAEDPALYWIEPQQRGILLLDQVHVPRRLARTIRQGIIRGQHRQRLRRRDRRLRRLAARPAHDLDQSEHPRALSRAVHARGYCHTVETWQDGKLVGGLYGVALGGAFFGESMFSTERDASKVALVYLCARLIHGGFTLLDTQFMTEHLRQFGAIEIDRAEFHTLLETGAGARGGFLRPCRRRAAQIRSSTSSHGGRLISAARADGAADVVRAAARCAAARRRRAGRCRWLLGSLRCRRRALGLVHTVSQTSNTGCSGGLSPGLSANIQPREDALFLAVEHDLVDLDEGGGLGRLGGGARVAGARRDLEGAELGGLVERHVRAA